MKKYFLPALIIIFTIGGYLGIKYFASSVSKASLKPVIEYEEKQYESLYTKPSREARESCEWEEKEFETLGIKFLAEVCENIEHNYIARENLLYLSLNENEISENSIKLLEVFEKDKESEITQAINNRFFPDLNQEQAEICVVKGETNLELEFPKENYSISPSDEYLEDEYSKIQQDPSYQPCGYYGEIPEKTTYFEYHPTEFENKYMFVFLDIPVKFVDEQSFIFTNNNTGQEENSDSEDSE